MACLSGSCHPAEWPGQSKGRCPVEIGRWSHPAQGCHIQRLDYWSGALSAEHLSAQRNGDFPGRSRSSTWKKAAVAMSQVELAVNDAEELPVAPPGVAGKPRSDSPKGDEKKNPRRKTSRRPRIRRARKKPKKEGQVEKQKIAACC